MGIKAFIFSVHNQNLTQETIFRELSSTNFFVKAKWTNYTKICVKICKKLIFLSRPPVLIAAFLFESK